MSKKTRRYRTPNLPTSAYGAPGSAPEKPVMGATPVRVVSPARASSPAAAVANRNWQDEYREVFGDLKRTGIIAIILLGVMIALSFIIR